MRSKTFFICFVFSVTLLAQVNTFSFNINGSVPAGFTTALNIAGQKWSNYLQISVPIKVNIFTVNSGLLPFSAITLANGRKNFSNAPMANVLYPTTLANQLAGSETNAGEFDMDIYFNLATSYYFGTGKPPANQTDFISTAMHEMGHGLGFYSDGYVNNSGQGSFGNIPPSALFPLTPSFPWRGQDTVPSIFDRYIVRPSGNSLVGIAAQDSPALGDSIKNGPLYFSGPLYANASHSNTPVRLSGGAGTFTLGVDLLHIHNSYANTIMSYYWGSGDTVRIPGPWELGILREIGWNLKPVGIKEQQDVSIISAYPSPANSSLTIKARNIGVVRVENILGNVMIEKNNISGEDELVLDTGDLKEGVYFLSLVFSGNNKTVTRKILVSH
jgi:hypothetical protein